MDDQKQVLEYIKRVRAMAKTGLTYAKDPYDIERYEELVSISHAMLNNLGNLNLPSLRFHFDQLDDYPTPKVDVRGIVLKEGRILLIKEKTDGRWAMPGGWCDIGYSPAENVAKEVVEESGLEVKPTRLLSVWDKSKHDHPDDIHYVYKLNFFCEITGGVLQPGHETAAAEFFAIDDLPPLSLMRNTPDQIEKLYQLASKDQEIDFD